MTAEQAYILKLKINWAQTEREWCIYLRHDIFTQYAAKTGQTPQNETFKCPLTGLIVKKQPVSNINNGTNQHHTERPRIQH